MANLFQELRRRNVYKIATVYMVASWVLLQVADTVFPAFGFSQASFRTITLVLIACFPLAIILAWFYELTPDGIKKTSNAGQGTALASGGTDLVVIFLLLVLVGFTARDEFSGFSQSTSNGVAQTQAPQVIRASLNLGDLRPSTYSGLYSEIALSPDGSRLVYSAIRNGEAVLYLRELNEEESSVIANISLASQLGSYNPVFSKDSESIFYTIGEDALEMQIVEYLVSSGITQVQVDQSFASRISAADDGSIWYQGPNYSVYHYSPNSATEPALVLGVRDLGGGPKAQPQELPDGKTVLLSTIPTMVAISEGISNIHLLHLETNELELLIEGAHYPHYVPTGHIVFMRGTTLWAVAFDVENLRIVGNEYPVLPGIAAYEAGAGAVSFSFSENGRLVYLPTEFSSDAALIDSGLNTSAGLNLVDRQGAESPIELAELGVSFSPSQLSPNENKIAITVLDSLLESIWVYDFERETVTRLTDGAGYNPKWSADGETIYYSGGGISSIASNGLGDRIRHYSGRANNIEVTPDGAQFIFDTSSTLFLRTQGSSDIFSLPTSARRDTDSPVALMATPFDEQDATISPDGNWIAYASNRSGRSEIYVQPFPNLEDDRWQISNSGGYKPQWTSNGTELVYAEDMQLSGNNLGSNVVAVAIDTTGGFSAGIPEPLFALEKNVWDFTVSSDGSRFLLSGLQADRNDDYVRPVSLTLVENWFEELKRLAPADLL